jgi:hypothetical protein
VRIVKCARKREAPCSFFPADVVLTLRMWFWRGSGEYGFCRVVVFLARRRIFTSEETVRKTVCGRKVERCSEFLFSWANLRESWRVSEWRRGARESVVLEHR